MIRHEDGVTNAKVGEIKPIQDGRKLADKTNPLHERQFVRSERCDRLARRSAIIASSAVGSAQPSAIIIRAAESGSSIMSPTRSVETSIPFRIAASFFVSRIRVTTTLRESKSDASWGAGGLMLAERVNC